MRLLLDTHVWFWALQSPDELGERCRSQLESGANTLVTADERMLAYPHATTLDARRQGMFSSELASVGIRGRIVA